eukprot:CAMPEP_0119417160 /NCGR_PEP_ID=MMETSP1335-20130426/15065_1 /TAXON_ID=259385 /ORGANISM="Chrysoculter rhomboideus, Strain RCC1486" /LENGTH=62 /DNA_ID=CAMNT_0007442321 /DNA_START=182 /DNA_END=367 /DNA_ORIENTATION=+
MSALATVVCTGGNVELRIRALRETESHMGAYSRTAVGRGWHTTPPHTGDRSVRFQVRSRHGG